MHIIASLAIGAALLYFWLIGHWFARVLMFLCLAAVFGFLGASLLAATQDAAAAAPVPGIIGATLGAGAAWYIAGIPLWVQRAKEKQRRWDRQTTMPQATTVRSASPYAPAGMPAAPTLALPPPQRAATD